MIGSRITHTKQPKVFLVIFFKRTFKLAVLCLLFITHSFLQFFFFELQRRTSVFRRPAKTEEHVLQRLMALNVTANKDFSEKLVKVATLRFQ